VRTLLVGIHRYVGLGIAGFLAITGLTGSILAFREPLDRWLNPDLLTVPASPGFVANSKVSVLFEAFAPRPYRDC